MLLDELSINVDVDPIPEYTKIAGVSFYDRQNLINKLIIGEDLILKRDYKNEYDKFAIGIYSDNGLLGWIPKYIAKTLAIEMDNCLKWKAIVSNITGEDKDTKGVNIKLVYLDE